MLILTRRRIGRLTDLRLGQTASKALIASAVMAAAIALTSTNACPASGTQAAWSGR